MIDIEIPGNPPILSNARMNWKKKMRLANEWYAQVHWTLKEHKAIPPEPFTHAVVHYTRYAPGRAPDQTNLPGSFKWVEDGLVKSGVLLDDSPDHVQNFYHWERSKQKDKRIRIQVTPIPRP